MINAWGITDRGAVRQQNQDGYYLMCYSDDLAVGVVCDGMGGARAGNVASLLAVETFSDAMDVLKDGPAEDPAALLLQAAEAANTAVFRRAGTDADCRGMGTTLVAALVKDRHAWLLNIGDSRAYHVGKSGIVKLTRDHSVVEDLVRRGGHLSGTGQNPPPEEPDHQGAGVGGQGPGRSLRKGTGRGGVPAPLF